MARSDLCVHFKPVTGEPAVASRINSSSAARNGGSFFKELAAATSGTHAPAGRWRGLFYVASSTQDGRATQPCHACEMPHATMSALGS